MLLAFAGSIFLILGAGVLSSLPAAAQQYVAGQHYAILDEPLSTSSGDKIEVMELFWYGCPHCFAFEPQVDDWLRNKPENAEFVRLPAVFRAGTDWETHARAYYTFVVLGIVDEVHSDFFDAIHTDRKAMNTESALVDFLDDYGVSEKDAMSAMNSFATDNYMRSAIALVRQPKVGGAPAISSVPSIIVDGKYLTGITEAGSREALLDVVNYLVAKAASER